jgi:lipoate-protein ligase A
MNWRLICDDNATASFGLAADDVLTQRVGKGKSQPTLRLYTYAPCALVGRFQTVEHELHVDYCQDNNIPINRRPTGGGAIIMGQGQLGIGLMIPGSKNDSYSRARELMSHFAAGILQSLAALGIEANFQRKTDIEVNGRKMVGLGIYRAPSNGLLFHASILVDLDVPYMLKVLNTPFEKISDKEIKMVSARTTDVHRELGKPISIDDLRHSLAEGYKNAFDVQLTAGGFTTEELTAIQQVEVEKYQTDEWVFQKIEVEDTFGSAKTKTEAGLLDIRASLAGRTVKAIFVGGDFFASENAIADIEASLRWHSSKPQQIAATLAKIYAKRQSELNRISLADLTGVIQTAVKRASIAGSKAQSDPYGCFVTPENARV